MCGIVGSFRPGRQGAGPEIVSRMRDRMSHRGPDGAGLWCARDKSCTFGHRRLSIIDLSTDASQPMTNEAYYTGGPAYYIGPESDINTQETFAGGIGGIDGHPWNGAFGGRRIGARAGILAAAALISTATSERTAAVAPRRRVMRATDSTE